MELQIEVISKEIIKPSSPTPDQLRHYKLSFLDQLSPPVYSPLALFYPPDGDGKFNQVEKSDHLRQSLSEVLTHYYPLAGRIKDNLFVDCNDEGILYLEAEVKCKLADIIENPVPSELNKLMPFALDDVQELPLGIQFNIFQCGGIVIGLVLSHNVGDASSLFSFVKTWAATTRGETDIVYPEFISAALFPPLNMSGFKRPRGITHDNVVTKRFVFKSSPIESLKEKYGKIESLKDQRPPSRVEVLSAFIWRRFMVSTKVESGSNKIYSSLHTVNLRSRMEPPLPENSFGNYYRIAITAPSADPGEECDLVALMRDSISKIDKEYAKNLQKGSEHLNFMKQQAEIFYKDEMVTLSFTSLCRFPLYDADFGWGKPIWVGAPSLTFTNLVVFMDAASGDGIEAIVHLKAEDMIKFQEDEKLLQFISPDEY